MSAVRLRQWWSDLLAHFWLRPALMTVSASALAMALVRLEGVLDLPGWLDAIVYGGDMGAARDVLGVIAGASIGVAGTTFSITVAALAMATSQMGPRLLRNFTRDPGNQYTLGTLVASFAYSLIVLRSVHGADNSAFVPHLAVTAALLFAAASVAMLIWFIHHVASSINLDHVVALVHSELSSALQALPPRPAAEDDACPPPTDLPPDWPGKSAAPLAAPGSGYLRVLDDHALANWAAENDALLRLFVRPGGYVFPGSTIGEVVPALLHAAAQQALATGVKFGEARNVEQDVEYAVRQMVEVGLRALSPGINDPFTAITVLDHLGAALCNVADRSLPDGCTWRDGVLRLQRPATDYAGLVDAMFHMLRQAGCGMPSVIIRMLEVLGAVAAVEQDPQRRRVLRRHVDLAYDAGLASTGDPSALAALGDRHAAALQVIGAGATRVEA